MQVIKNEDCKTWFGLGSRAAITKAIGEAMHTIQDVYAHTDYVEGTQNGMRDLYWKYITEVDGYEWEYLTLVSQSRPSHSSPISLNSLENGDDFSSLVLYNGGVNPFDNSPHNWFAADEPNYGRDIYVIGAYQRAESLAIRSTAEFLKWAHDNMKECCWALLFAQP